MTQREKPSLWRQAKNRKHLSDPTPSKVFQLLKPPKAPLKVRFISLTPDAYAQSVGNSCH
ncbi:hypothetical protein C4K03_0309 [Pseudomonas synxantha]|uniref:Uncharacterized protein n=1 Tax=Pseudomonas synxantha TaxID=47883 RepID=A0A3G7U1W1_9PSED|nr:hypothetical protein C4K03_0309 [Pseudomonas synxantha]